MKAGYRVVAVLHDGTRVVVDRIYPVMPAGTIEWQVINPHDIPVHRNCNDFDHADGLARRLDRITNPD